MRRGKYDQQLTIVAERVLSFDDVDLHVRHGDEAVVLQGDEPVALKLRERPGDVGVVDVGPGPLQLRARAAVRRAVVVEPLGEQLGDAALGRGPVHLNGLAFDRHLDLRPLRQ